MGLHINTLKDNISEKILLPGDPLRAKWIAENFLTDFKCYNEVRGMFGYTGFYKNEKVSIQGTGMGIPSFSIYFNELAFEYNIKKAVRIGTTGAIQPNIELFDLIFAQSASTDSSFNKIRFNGADFAPCCNFDLLKNSVKSAEERNIKFHVGSILTSDTFYEDEDRKNYWKKWADFKVLAIEMETSALYTLGAKYNVDVLSILSVTDQIVNKKAVSTSEREKALYNMVEIALNSIIV